METVCADSETETESVFYSSKCNNSSTQQYTQLHSKCNNSSTQQYTQLYSKPPAYFGFFSHHQGAIRQKKID